MPWTSRAAGLVGLTAIGIAMYALLGPAGSHLAFAQVAEKIATAKTVSFDSALIPEDKDAVVRKSREYYAVPGKARQEWVTPAQEAGTYVVQDFVAGTSLVVIPQVKTAIATSIKGGAEIDPARRMLDFLQSLPEKKPRQLGEKQVAGVRAKGFEVDAPHSTTTVWADATSGAPLLIEILQKDAGSGRFKQVLTNIKLNEELDAAMFSIEPPQGYVLRRNAPLELDSGPATAVARLLETYAQHMEGRFPQSLAREDLEPLIQKLTPAGGLEPGQLPEQDALLQLPADMAVVAVVTSKLKAGQRWQYDPAVERGQKDRIVFWYHDPKSDTYSAVYGDLRVETVAKEQLPPPGTAPES